MVLFDNVNLNQHVELLRNGKIYRGVVKYKGCLNGVAGEWVGVELNENVGKHDGMIKGRRYFSCNPGHGIFVPSEKLRFSTKQRCLYNSYLSVERDEDVLVDHELFGLERPSSASPYGPKTISKERYNVAKSGSYSDYDAFRPERSFHKSHNVSRTLPAATMFRPHTAHPTASMYRSTSQYGGDNFEEWTSSPSIPQTHMPTSAMVRLLREKGAAGRKARPLTPGKSLLKSSGSWGLHEGDGCWEGPHQHYPREWRVNTGRESVKWDKWNDVSL